MPDSTSITQARSLSVQSPSSAGVLPITWMTQAGLHMPQWWSTARDEYLRKFWKKVDHLSGAVYTLEAKIASIPFTVVARDPSIHAHVTQAEEYTRILNESVQFGEGWVPFLTQWVEEYVTQDNGVFSEIIGFGEKDGPIIGRPLTVAHLDSARCSRTGDPEYPVIYYDTDGKRYKLHYSRVMFSSQMSSPIKDMNGVGFCSVSRCVNVAQTLLDILTFKQEKLGSRPHRAVMIPRGGLDPNDIRDAFQLAEQSMDSSGLSRYSKVVVAGSATLPEAALDVIELSSMPDGFDEQTSVTLGMAIIALGFGVDARELFPAMQAGATRAEALLQHLKQRGKAPGQILQVLESLFDQKFLPNHLHLSFDFQDDAQDRQQAEIHKIRADKRTADSTTGAITSRITREQMVESSDLTRSQFERLELMDGRLADGTPVVALFYSDDKQMQSLLDVGADDPLDIESNDIGAMTTIIREQLTEINKILVNTRNETMRYKARQAQMALVYLQEYYKNPQILVDIMLGQNPNTSNINASTGGLEQRVRRLDLTQPNTATETELDRRTEMGKNEPRNEEPL